MNTQDNCSLPEHTVYYLKLWEAIIKDGREVMETVFLWGYHGDPNIKGNLFSLPFYTNRKFRSEFDAVQREKIEKGLVGEYDLSLLFLLIQRLCGLPPPDSDVWNTSLDDFTLPSLLVCIKKKRNYLAHGDPQVTKEESECELKLLEDLLMCTLDKAAFRYNIPDSELRSKKLKIINHLKGLLDRGPSTDLLSNSKEIAREKAAVFASEGRAELSTCYKCFARVKIVAVPYIEVYQDISSVFSEPQISRSTDSILYNQYSESESVIQANNILQTALPSGMLPHVIVIVSASGMGKTTLAKYLTEEWINGGCTVRGLDEIDILFYADLRGPCFRSFDELLASLMPRTVQLYSRTDLKSLIMSCYVLVILDNIDDVSKAGVPFLEEVLRCSSEKFRVITTVTQKVSSAFGIHFFSVKPLQLELQGLLEENIKSYFKKVFSSWMANIGVTDEQTEDFFSDYFLNVHEQLVGKFTCSLELVTYCFCQWLFSQNRCCPITKAQIAQKTHEMLVLKLREKIGLTLQPSLLDAQIFENHLKEITVLVGQVAVANFPPGSVLPYSSIHGVISKCRECEIPFRSVIPMFFAFLESLNKLSLKQSVTVSFHSRSMHFYYASFLLAQDMERHESESVRKIFEKYKAWLDVLTEENLFTLTYYIFGILCQKGTVHSLKKAVYLVEDLKSRLNGRLTMSQCLVLMQETKDHETVFHKIRNMMGDTFAVEDEDINGTLVTVLEKFPPTHLTITINKKTTQPSKLREVLRVCSKTNSLNLTLHMYHYFWVEKQETCDVYLDMLCHEGTCNLQNFAGRLSFEGLVHVPSTLSRLALHITPDLIGRLNDCLQTMKSLQILYLNFDVQPIYDSRHIQRVKIPLRTTSVCVDLWNVESSCIKWACAVATALSPAYSRLALRRTRFAFEDGVEWLEGLRDCRVHVDTAIVGSYNDIASCDLNCLKELASSFSCDEFRWIHL